MREVIGLDIGEVESGSFWVEFLRSLKKRGLSGVRLAISDQHEGLKTELVDHPDKSTLDDSCRHVAVTGRDAAPRVFRRLGLCITESSARS